MTNLFVRSGISFVDRSITLPETQLKEYFTKYVLDSDE